MRAAKRWVRAQVWEWRMRHRRREVARELQQELNLPSPPKLFERGNLGHDSNYNVFSGGEQIGVLRLVNPHKRRPEPPAEMPFRIAGPSLRIKHEFDIYGLGAASGLTPEPLWKAPDALFCRYLPYRPLMTWVKKTDDIWPLLIEGSATLHRLHLEVGIGHMDASLGNVIASRDRTQHALVDFEYLPADDVTFAEQRIYDHLRLVHSSWKFIKSDQRRAFGPWLEQLAGYLDDDMRKADFARIAPALENVLKDEAWRVALRELFEKAP